MTLPQPKPPGFFFPALFYRPFDTGIFEKSTILHKTSLIPVVYSMGLQ
jgi:hypothetical protein